MGKNKMTGQDQTSNTFLGNETSLYLDNTQPLLAGHYFIFP